VASVMWEMDNNAEAGPETKANSKKLWFFGQVVESHRDLRSVNARLSSANKESTLNHMQFIGITEGHGHGTSKDID
jgi:hypothetical protein